jgi:hypothetical protein
MHATEAARAEQAEKRLTTRWKLSTGIISSTGIRSVTQADMSVATSIAAPVTPLPDSSTFLHEHLDWDQDDDLIDPSTVSDAVRRNAAELDAWHEGGRRGARPPGRLRTHITGVEDRLPARHRWFTAPVYRRSSTRTAARGGCDCAVRTDPGPMAVAAARPEWTG